MLGDSSLSGSSGDAPAVQVSGGDGGAVAAGPNSAEELERVTGRAEENERNFAGNRWPREETLALLKIRSEIDSAFRGASVKGPLWEEVSKKLAELGFHRTAKKCKEKFENVYKYHKRTKEGRSGKQEGKSYRFSDQLEALEGHPPFVSAPPSKPQLAPAPMASIPVVNNPATVAQVTVPSTTAHPITATVSSQGIVASTMNLTVPSFPAQPNSTILPSPSSNPPLNPPQTTIPSSFTSISDDLISDSTSSATSSDEELEGRQRQRRRKRKWKDLFERVMKEVIRKQEELQSRFLEAIEKRERDRMAREEAWRAQEMMRINRERELLAQERSLAASKDAAVMAFLQKISQQQNQTLDHLGQAQNVNFHVNVPQLQVPQPQAPPSPQLTPPPPQQPPNQPNQLVEAKETEPAKSENNGENHMSASSSRWPKEEVEALIDLRTKLDAKYQESGPKAPLWEDIAAEMRGKGYNRSAKRCKEKWENINKYFKKVKESNRRRPEDSKTCPYFHQLDQLYKEKFENPSGSFSSQNKPPEPSSMVPLMVQPEQQWPPLQQETTRPEPSNEEMESERTDQNMDIEDEDGEDEDEDGEGGGNNYEIVASKPPPSHSPFSTSER